MNANQVVEGVSRQVQIAKEKGYTEVTIESLEAYLLALQDHITQQAPLTQANIDFQKLANEHAFQSEHEMFKSVIDSGQAALKTGLLIGGGSAAALLAFASSTWKSLRPEGLEMLGITIFLLGLGVIGIGIAASLTYLSQCFYHEGLRQPENCRSDKIANGIRILACVLVAGAYLLFFWSSWNVFQLMKSFPVDTFFPVG